MKPKFHIRIIIKICAIILLSAILLSCSNALFDQPQPIDSKNLKKIPKELRGAWIDNRDTIIIDKSSYTHISFLDDHITKAEIDTIEELKIVNDTLYIVNEDPNIKDFQYIQKNDTFFYTLSYINDFYCLSDSVLLRKAKHSFVCSVKRGNWWELFVIKKGKNGEIQIYYPNANALKDNQLKYGINQLDTVKVKTKGNLYFHARLNTDFFDKYTNDNVFSLYITLFPNSTFDIEN